MAVAIVISGSINSGKTTVSRLLASRLPRTAHIEVDALRAFVSSLPLEESTPLNLRNAASVARNLLQAGLNVVIDYPLGKSEYERLSKGLGSAPELHAFVLTPRLAVVLRDRGDRALDDRERYRIVEMYAAGVDEPGFGICIDNSNFTPDQTVDAILAHLGIEPAA